MSAQTGKLIIALARPKYRLAELLSQITPDNRHDEVDWGAPKGTEEW